MTILGKILVFVVLALSLLWTFLTASTFAARTNWQARAKQYQDDAQKAARAATDMKGLLDAEREAYAESLRVMREDRDRFAATTDLIAKDREKLLAQYNELVAANQKLTASQEPLIGTKQKLADEITLKDEQIRSKDAEINKLTLSEQAAVVEASKRVNEAKVQTDRADRLRDQLQVALDTLERARLGGGVTRPGTEARTPAPAGFRASVVSAAAIGGETYVTINQGLDAGLLKNTELTLARINGSGTYLGKLIITQVNPKDAIGRFAPPGNKRLTTTDYPRAGDTATGSTGN